MTQQEEIGLQHYLDMLWRRRGVILAVFVAVFVLCVIWVSMTKTIYQAKSLVALKNQLYNRQVLLPFAPGADSAEQGLYGDSWAKIINGVPFAEKVSNAAATSAEPVAIEPTEVHASLRAEFHEPDLIEITVRHIEPETARRLADVTADTFVEENVATLKSNITSFSQHAQSKMEQYQQELREADTEIARFKEGMGFVNIDGEIDDLKETIGAFEKESATVQTEIEIAESHVQEIRAMARLFGGNGDSALVDAPQIEQLRQLQEMLTNARLRYTDRHPTVLNLEAQLRDIETRVQKSLEASGIPISPERYLQMRDELVETEAKLADLRTARSSWDRQIAGLRGRLSAFPEKKFQLEQLESRAEEARNQYASWREKVDDANSQASTVQGNASVADYASRPMPAISKVTNLILGFIVAVFLGVGMGFVVEFADSSIRTPEEVSRAVGLGFLGSISRLKDPKQVVFSGGTGAGVVSEAYRKIYSNIKFASLDTPVESMMVTSARKGEGKSTTLVNLSCAIAASGKRVIIVDTDLRNPSLQKILKTRHQAGVTTVLAGECSLDDALQMTDHPGLVILPAGPMPPNPSELLQSLQMRELIAELKTRCDLIIFDSPPTLLVADAMLMAAEVDATIIVLESGGVTRREVQHVRDTLQTAKSRILGVILNKVSESLGGYAYNYYTYYTAAPEGGGDQQAEPVGALGWVKESVKSLNSRIGGNS